MGKGPTEFLYFLFSFSPAMLRTKNLEERLIEISEIPELPLEPLEVVDLNVHLKQCMECYKIQAQCGIIRPCERCKKQKKECYVVTRKRKASSTPKEPLFDPVQDPDWHAVLSIVPGLNYLQ